MMSNIRSLRGKVDEVRHIVGELQPQLVAFTETWLSPSVFDGEIYIPGYDFFRADRSHSRAGGGVILYYAKGLYVQLLDACRNDDGTEESLICRVKSGPRTATLVLVYRSPCSDGSSTLQTIERWRRKSDCLIMGDFNAPNVIWPDLVCSSPPGSFEASLLEWTLESNLNQHVLEPTRRIFGQSHNTLDLVFSPRQADLGSIRYLPPIGTSDHSTLLFQWQGCEPIQSIPSARRDFFRCDFDSLRVAASNIDWSIPSYFSTEEAWCYILGKLQDPVIRFVPVIKRRKPTRGPPWIDKELCLLFKRRKKLWNMFRLSGTFLDYDSYKACRNECSRLKTMKRINFEYKLSEQSRYNPQPLFAYLKRRTKAGAGIPALLLGETDIPAEDDDAKASILATQYASIYEIEQLPVPNFPQRTVHSLDDLTFTITDVKDVLLKLSPYSAPGPDDLHPLLLRNLADVIAPPFCTLFQLSLDEGRLPSQWKTAVVKPMHKGGSRHSPENYRPISLTSVVCKCMERLIKRYIHSHLGSLGLISPKQHGFRTQRSCVSNLLMARESWVSALDTGARLDVVFVDFSKAFDKVPHQRLLAKLTAHGIRGKMLTWIADFLMNRHVRVKVNDVSSDAVVVSSGVPQGSVLGPELFSLYINDLPEALGSDCLLYADDLKLWGPVSCLGEANNFKSTLDALYAWSQTWQLPVNLAKCSVLALPSGVPITNYHIGGHTLRTVSSERDLGIIVASDLTSSLDSIKRASAASRLLGAIRRSFSRMTPDIFRKLFSSHVRPILEFGQPAVYPLTKGESDIIERVQRRGSKAVIGLRQLTYEQRLQHLGMFTLAHRRRRGDLIYARRILFGELGEDLRKFFPLNTDGPTRGHQHKLFKLRRLRMRMNMTLSTRVVNDWNRLPSTVIESTSEACFKTRLDNFFSAVRSQD